MNMARHNRALASIHRIIQRNAYAQALFFFVDGAISRDSHVSPREAILMFQQRYDIAGLDVECEVTAYNRMRSEYLNENKIFENGKQGDCIRPCNRKDTANACKGMGTAGSQ